MMPGLNVVVGQNANSGLVVDSLIALKGRSVSYDLRFHQAGYVNKNALNPEQIELLQKIISETFEGSPSRALNYVCHNPVHIGGAFVPTGDEVVDGLVLSIGMPLIGAPKMLLACADLPFKTITMMFGGAAATILVACYGNVTYQKLNTIKQTPVYKLWAFERDIILRNEVVKDFIMSLPEMRLFICAISKKLPAIPVREKGTELVYDLDEFKEWIRENPHEIAEQSGKPYTLADVEFDFAHMHSMIDRIFNLLQKAESHLRPQHFAYESGVNLFFDQFGIKGGAKNLREICLEYFEKEVPKVSKITPQHSSNELLDHLSLMVKRNIALIEYERAYLKNLYDEERRKTEGNPSKELARLTTALTSKPRKVVHYKNVALDNSEESSYVERWISTLQRWMGRDKKSTLVTIDLEDSERRIGLEEYPLRIGN